MDYVFQMYDVVKNYKGKNAINHSDMNIKKGEIYGFIGENGAGKTTVIRLISGLITQTSGAYELFETKHDDPKIHLQRSRLGAIVESVTLIPNLNARNNLLAQMKLLGLKDLNYINDILHMVGLGNVTNDPKKVKQYSLGMKQRLGLAIALINKPEFLILDEPTNGLDPRGIIEFRELILKLNRDHGITFLISSHNLDELSKIATCYGFITRGKIVQEVDATTINDEKQLETIFMNVTGGNI